jgi:hypothetical protein
MGFVIAGGCIKEIDAIADPDRVATIARRHRSSPSWTASSPTNASVDNAPVDRLLS